MGFKVLSRIAAILAGLALCCGLSAQEKKTREDSLVRLMKGSSVRLIEKDGKAYREAADATFLHNGTYLICDTAIWNVDEKVINAFGHVQIIQDETVLTSDKLDYVIDENMAKFRGTLVQLRDKENSTLRTRHLDYNTKDSVAIFSGGASMKDKTGQIIESEDGHYFTADKMFTFRKNVNMFTDSIFVRTEELDYHSGRNEAIFRTRIDFWKDDNMLTADCGNYKRAEETFFFTGNVHGTTKDQESWSDSLYYYRTPGDILLLGRAQMQDTTRNTAALAGYIYYCDSSSRITMKRDAAFAMKTDRDGKVDTLYFGADAFFYEVVRKCDIPEAEVKCAAERLSDMFVDPVSEYRRRAAEEAAKAKEEEEKAQQGGRPQPGGKPQLGPKKDKPAPPQEDTTSLQAPSDSLSVPVDSLAAALDTIPPPPDTTGIGFLEGVGNVKIFRRDLQAKADSLRYNDLDSIARFYIDPIIWNEGRRQYSSDSLFCLVRNGGMDRASLLSNAFIITEEDSVYYDQIKATEVMAYFDSTAALTRFDALGGANAHFYLKENGVIATVNVVESKMLSATMYKGDVDRVYYYDSPKNDAYPCPQLPAADHRMKGFNWSPDLRPASKADITPLEVKPSERAKYAKRPKAEFKYTDIYFPGYIAGVYREIEVRDSLSKIPRPDTTSALELKKVDADSVSVIAASDSLKAGADSLAAPMDSSSVKAPSDSTAAAADSLGQKEKVNPKKAAREAARKARWDKKDAEDAAKAAAKKEKEAERHRKRVLREIERIDRQNAADDARRAKFEEKFRKKKLKEEMKKAKKYGNVVE